MSPIATLYLTALAAMAGYAMIARVPSILHLTLLSGANFVHGVVLCGAMITLARADDGVERAIGFAAVALASANVVGGYFVTDRLLRLFERRAARAAQQDPRADDSAPGDADAPATLGHGEADDGSASARSDGQRST